jgi:hypothetical protein
MRSCWQDIAVVPLLVILPILGYVNLKLCFYTLRLHMRWLCLTIISTVRIVLENHNRMAQTADQVIETYHPWIFSWRSFSSIPVRMEWMSLAFGFPLRLRGWKSTVALLQSIGDSNLWPVVEKVIARTWSHICRWSSLPSATFWSTCSWFQWIRFSWTSLWWVTCSVVEKTQLNTLSQLWMGVTFEWANSFCTCSIDLLIC